MGAIVCIVIMALLFLVMSLFFFQGKGGFLISGYNTASTEEKAQYDEKKLCRATGVICVVVSILLGVMAFFAYRVETGLMEENSMIPFAIVFVVVICVTVGGAIYYMNTKCKKKE